ncbi:ice-binding family protein [Nocardioides sp.]|uniref:ice-binding family protein n=1 Tax=Nocardioides sp. TaxID=35761 RepID=UPI00356727DC
MTLIRSVSVLGSALGLVLVSAGSAQAAQAPVGLGTATSFAVLAGSAVTNTGPSAISGDVGVSPGTAISGFPPAQVTNGEIHASDAVAMQAQDDLTTAYDDAAGRSPVVDQTGVDLGGQALQAGVYQSSSSMSLTGTVTLDAEGDPDAVFIFQAGSTLITASSSTVALVGGAQACNVFWQVGSSATLGTDTDFVGTLIALTSITLDTGTDVEGRVLARNGSVSLDTNTITSPTCDTVTPSSTASATSTAFPSATASPSDGDDGDGSGGGGGDGSGGGDGADGSAGGAGGGSEDGGSEDGGRTDDGRDPVVPDGHPETGRAHEGELGPNLWFGLAIVTLMAAGAAAFRGSRRFAVVRAARR